MKIALLASNPKLYSNLRILDAGRSRGHEMQFINIRNCYMNISAFKPQIHYRGGRILNDFQAVIPRIRPSLTFYGTAVVRHFEMMGVYCLNGSHSITRSRDKLRTLQFLMKKGINMPVTGFANSHMDTQNLIKLVGGAPVIVKLLESTQGVGVVLTETNKGAESVINAFKSLKANILVQEFVKESAGKDIRCFVVGDNVVAAMQRQASGDEYRSNIHRGGKASIIEISSEERDMAVKSARLMGLKVAGVDVIQSKDGPKLLEVNSSPGLEGIESVTGIDIADLMIRHIEENIERETAKQIPMMEVELVS